MAHGPMAAVWLEIIDPAKWVVLNLNLDIERTTGCGSACTTISRRAIFPWGPREERGQVGSDSKDEVM